jgi:hypothetical protein
MKGNILGWKSKMFCSVVIAMVVVSLVSCNRSLEGTYDCKFKDKTGTCTISKDSIVFTYIKDCSESDSRGKKRIIPCVSNRKFMYRMMDGNTMALYNGESVTMVRGITLPSITLPDATCKVVYETSKIIVLDGGDSDSSYRLVKRE